MTLALSCERDRYKSLRFVYGNLSNLTFCFHCKIAPSLDSLTADEKYFSKSGKTSLELVGLFRSSVGNNFLHRTDNSSWEKCTGECDCLEKSILAVESNKDI